MMSGLFILLLILVVKALCLPNASAGVRFFLMPSLEKFAGSNSNMVKFGKLGMLLCPDKTSTDVIRRVFGSGGIEGCRNKKSQLQKNLADHLTNGGIFRGGRIIIDPQTI